MKTKNHNLMSALEDLFFLAAVLLSLAAGAVAFVETSNAFAVMSQPASVAASLVCSPDEPTDGSRG